MNKEIKKFVEYENNCEYYHKMLKIIRDYKEVAPFKNQISASFVKNFENNPRFEHCKKI